MSIKAYLRNRCECPILIYASKRATFERERIEKKKRGEKKRRQRERERTRKR